MIKLTKLCNERRIEEERTPPENDFSSGCEFSFGKSYATGLEMCGSHTSLRSSVSSHPTFRVIGQKVCVTNPNKLENL